MRVTIIGSGNVAYSLTVALGQSNTALLHQIHSRNREKGVELANIVSSEFVERLEDISPNADIYIIAVKDNEIEGVIDRVKDIVSPQSTICHTSAVCAIGNADNVARLYPLQSFSRGVLCDFSKITFFIETNSSKSEQNIITLCKIFGTSYQSVDSEKLKVVHLAATFANNFTNRMYHYAEQILKSEGIDRDVLYPLISEGVDKLINSKTPAKMLQTGAAVRRDDSTIEAHRLLLKGNDELLEIYNTISKAIYNDKL